MHNEFPDFDTYRKLYYARFWDHDKSLEFLRTVPIKEKRVLELCGGTGDLAAMAIKEGAKNITLVDICPQMFDPNNIRPEIRTIFRSVRSFLAMNEEKFDIVLCQQSVNYWLEEIDANLLYDALNPGGIFVFNTIKYCPKREIYVDYSGGQKGAGVTWLCDKDTIHHAQIMEGLPPHFNSFKWISKDRFFEILSPKFEIKCTETGRGLLFRCVRRD